MSAKNVVGEMAAKVGQDFMDSTSAHQQTSMMGAGSSPIQNAYIKSKAKEDIFLKNNLEYEQRLKTHLYQFDEENGRQKRGNQSIDDS